jgi:hypothetical protein
MNYIAPTMGDINIYKGVTELYFNSNESILNVKGNGSQYLRTLNINVQLAAAILQYNKCI